ncbi:MAG TPA: GUN4 domain-containing protein [Coleofasciculaceae cyanobacterium]
MEPIALLIGLALGGVIGWVGRDRWGQPSAAAVDRLQHYLWQWHDRHAQSLDLLIDQQQELKQELAIQMQVMGDRLGALEQQVASLAPATLPEETNRLASEVGLDYLPLNDLLGTGQWREADAATRSYLLLAAGKGDRDLLTAEDLAQLPLTDLATIDQLWAYWSGGQFGWAAQRVLWQAANDDYGQFCDLVSWRNGEEWRYYDDLSFRATAPAGHLPTVVWTKRSCYGLGAATVSDLMAALLSRFAETAGE